MQSEADNKTRWRIFVVEDDEDDRYFMTNALTQIDYDIELTTFTNGQALLDDLVFDPILPNLIILDLNLPLLDGKETLRVLRSMPTTSDIPVVIYSTSNAVADMREVYALGASSYVVKPSNFEDIGKTLKSICDYWLQPSNNLELESKGAR